MNQVKEPNRTAKPIIDDPVQGGKLATSVDNLSAAGRWTNEQNRESLVFMVKSKVEAMLNKEKENASVSTICLDMKPHISSTLQRNHIKLDLLLHNSKNSIASEVIHMRTHYSRFQVTYELSLHVVREFKRPVPGW